MNVHTILIFGKLAYGRVKNNCTGRNRSKRKRGTGGRRGRGERGRSGEKALKGGIGRVGGDEKVAEEE